MIEKQRIKFKSVCFVPTAKQVFKVYINNVQCLLPTDIASIRAVCVEQNTDVVVHS